MPSCVRVPERITSTFTIAASDGVDWGIAVASRVLGVGGIVPAAIAGVGLVATQATVNVAWKTEGMQMLREGRAAAEVVRALVAADPAPEGRQIAVVDSNGKTAAFTGPSCRPWAGHKEGNSFVVAGNILAGPEVLSAMVASFEAGGDELAWRLVTALSAGDLSGGDARGRQSAALMVVRARGGIGGRDDRLLDLRVDDHRQPVEELLRVTRLGIAAYQSGFAASVRD
ncbi:MAG: DUF1028 domain-containing protein [Candidatus Dormibacteria bacterium]